MLAATVQPTKAVFIVLAVAAVQERLGKLSLVLQVAATVVLVAHLSQLGPQQPTLA
jgi:hypothetical protein